MLLYPMDKMMEYVATRQGRLSSVLREDMGLSAGLMNRLKWKQLIFVNGVSRHTDFLVQPGDVVSVDLEEPAPEYPAEDGDITILYEDDYILAVDKPAGMLIHPSRCQNSGTLANRIAGYYQRTGQLSAFHPVTRLDRDTFGVVLLAKNSHIHALLNQQNQQGALKKIYHALVYGGPEADSGRIDAPIARRPLPSLLREVREDGKLSVTEFKVLSRQENTCLLELCPVTGRTHQLRVHCAYCGFPILADPQYGSRESQAFSQQLNLKGQRLCAKALAFPHPVTGEPLVIESKEKVENSLRT